MVDKTETEIKIMKKELYLHKEFLSDIKKNQDPKLSKKILEEIVNNLDHSSNNKNDHKYKGLEDGWIRYLSKGSNAFRLIFFKKREKIIYYRVGNHDIEKRVSFPKEFDNNIVKINKNSDNEPFNDDNEMTRPNTILNNHSERAIFSSVCGRANIDHKAIYIISAYFEPSMLDRGTHMGGVFDKMAQATNDINILVRADEFKKFENYWKQFEQRGFNLFFLKDLHSKIYLFINRNNNFNKKNNIQNLGIIGSSNFTYPGINRERKGNYETNYSIDIKKIQELENEVIGLISKSDDYRSLLNKSKIKSKL